MFFKMLFVKIVVCKYYASLEAKFVCANNCLLAQLQGLIILQMLFLLCPQRAATMQKLRDVQEIEVSQ
jgi:hypothetical protein